MSDSDDNDDFDAGEMTTVTRVSGKLISETLKGRMQESEDRKAKEDPLNFKPPGMPGPPTELGPNQTYCLKIIDTDRAGQVHLIDERLTVGRNNADLNVKDNTLSANHCVFNVKQNVVSVMDNGSSNGTYVDGRRLRPGQLAILTINDKILLGKVQVAVVIMDKDDPVIIHTKEENEKKAMAIEQEESKKFFRAFSKKKKAANPPTSGKNKRPSFIHDDSLSDQLDNMVEDAHNFDTGETTGSFGSIVTKVKNLFKKGQTNDLEMTFNNEKTGPFNQEITPDPAQIVIAERDDAVDVEQELRAQQNIEKKLAADQTGDFQVEQFEEVKETVRSKKKREIREPIPVRSRARIESIRAAQEAKAEQKPDLAGAFHRLTANLIDMLVGYFLVTFKRDALPLESIVEQLSSDFNQLIVVKGYLDPLLKVTPLGFYLKFWAYIWPAFFGLFVVQLLSGAVMGRSFGQWVIGIDTLSDGLGSRIKAMIRAIIGYSLMPLLILDIPLLFQKRTFKEVITAGHLVLEDSSIKWMRTLVIFPLILIFSLGGSYFHSLIKNPDNLKGLALINLKSPKKPESQAVNNVNSAVFKGIVPVASHSDFVFYPIFKSRIEGNEKRYKPFLGAYHRPTKGVLEVSTLPKVNWREILTQSQKYNPYLGVKYPTLANWIDKKTSDEKDWTSDHSEELIRLVRFSLQLNSKTIMSTLANNGPFLDGAINLKQEVLKLYPSDFRPAIAFRIINNQKFIIMTENPTTDSNEKPQMLLLPLHDGSIPFIKVAAIGENSSAKAITPFVNEYIDQIQWDQKMETVNTVGHQFSGRAEDTFAILDLYRHKYTDNKGKTDVMNAIFQQYYHAGKVAVVENDPIFQTALITSARQFATLHQSLYKGRFDSLSIDLKRLAQAVEDKQERYFNPF